VVSGVAGGVDDGREGARDACVVGVRGAGGPAGVGVLVSRHEVVTCAHVVNAALGLPLEAAGRPAPPSPSPGRGSRAPSPPPRG
jgi:hypothetical protein